MSTHAEKEVHMYHVSSQFKMYIRTITQNVKKKKKKKRKTKEMNRGAKEWGGWCIWVGNRNEITKKCEITHSLKPVSIGR